MQGDSRVIMSHTKLKMQPIIHLERKAGYVPRPYPALHCKCIVGCFLIPSGSLLVGSHLVYIFPIQGYSREGYF
jgi:hypothetical protein